MANNNAFIDAIIAGAGGGAQTAWLSSSSAGTYATFKNAILEIATAVDGLIPAILPGPSLSQINLMESITAAVLSGRFPQNATPGTYADIAQKIVVLYNTLASSLNNVPNVYGGGGGSLTNLSNVFWVDYSTTVDPLNQNGNIETPYSRIAQAIAAVPANSVLLVTPNMNYVTEGFLTIDKNLSIIALNDSAIPWVYPTQMMSLTLAAGAIVTVQGFALSNGYGWGMVIMSTGAETVTLKNCKFSSVDNSLGGTVRVIDSDCSIYFGGRGGEYINCTINLGNCTQDSDLIFERCEFTGMPVFNMTGGYLSVFDQSSYRSLLSLGGSTNALSMSTGLPIQASVNVVVPGIAAGASAYVDVDVSATPIGYVTVGHSVLAWVNADMITAGQAGQLANARVTGTGTIRCCFTGEITGGSYPIVFAPL